MASPQPTTRSFPPHPYGGLGGEAVVERYEQLGCEPDDEFPAILAWFGLPADTPRDLEAGPLAEAVAERIEHDEAEGAVGFVTIGLHGADHGSAVLESHDAIPHNRVPGAPSCPHTFPDIDS